MRNQNAFEIAAQACRYVQAINDRTKAQGQLDDAYRAWKHQNGVNYYIGKASEEWREMLVATTVQYAAVVRAKRRERYCRDRLAVLVGRA